MQTLFAIRNWNHGLITFPAAEDLAEGASRIFRNVTGDQPGKVRGITNKKLYANGPSTSGYVMEWFAECSINDTDILISYLNDADAASNVDKDRFWYSDDQGASWVEITERFTTTVTGGTTTDFTIADAPPQSNTDDYMSGWVCSRDFDVSFDYVLNYVASSKTVTVKWGIGDTSGTVTFMRFPVWSNSGVSNTNHQAFIRNESPPKPSLQQRSDGVIVQCSRSRSDLTDIVLIVPDAPSFWFGYLDQKTYFGDNDLDYTGYWAEHKYLDRMFAANAISSITADADADNALPDADDYGVIMSYLLDNGQESIVYVDETLAYVITSPQVVTVASGESINVTLSIGRLTDATIYYAYEGTKRITAYRIYLAKVDQISDVPTYRAKSALYFVKEILIDDSLWSGTGPYTYSFIIGKAEWLAGLEQGDSRNVTGSFSAFKSSSDFTEVVEGREVAASLAVGIDNNILRKYDRKSYVAVTEFNFANINQADGLPDSKLQDIGDDGIYEILGIRKLGRYLMIYGRNQASVYRIDASGFLVEVRAMRGKGTTGYFSFHGNGFVNWWLSDDTVWRIDENLGATSISEPIRDKISAIQDKENAIISYEEDGSLLYLYADSTMYVFDEKRSFWYTYEQSATWTWLAPGKDNSMLASDGTDIYELLPVTGSTGTLSVKIQSPVFSVVQDVRKIEIDYNSDVPITITAYEDKDPSETPVALGEPLVLLPNRDYRALKKQIHTFDIDAKRLYLEMDVTWDTSTQSWELGQIIGLGDRVPINRQT